MQKITPFLWFEKGAEEAVNFYTDLFSAAGHDSKILTTTYYSDASAEVSGMPSGTIMTVEFEIDGQKFVAINGGPTSQEDGFKFTPAISFVINCKTQEEIDYFWEKFSADGGKPWECGWIKDKYGLTWQVTPEIWEKLLSDPDKEKSERVMKAMLKMKKIEIDKLLEAYQTDK